MNKGVIFDLDGVLVTTDEYHYKSWVKISEEEGIPFSWEMNNNFRGVGRMECVDILLSHSNKKYSKEEKEEIAKRKNEYFAKSLEEIDESVIMPGTIDRLKELKELGIKIGVGSNSRNAKTIIKKVNLDKYLDIITDGYDIKNSKPDPEVFLLTAKRLGLHNYECIVVEDAVAGVEAAHAAGMKALGIGSADRLTKAEKVIKNLSEITTEEMIKL
ncbi:MAG TPA: beta-phosphoglucomutase [Melioribacteraceae bacterium]|nr:beta-phosphoglucomutase [Melioribacteraceae bacterium]